MHTAHSTHTVFRNCLVCLPLQRAGHLACLLFPSFNGQRWTPSINGSQLAKSKFSKWKGRIFIIFPRKINWDLWAAIGLNVVGCPWKMHVCTINHFSPSFQGVPMCYASLFRWHHSSLFICVCSVLRTHRRRLSNEHGQRILPGAAISQCIKEGKNNNKMSYNAHTTAV